MKHAKSAYLKEDTRDAKAAELLAAVGYNTHRLDEFRPDRAALLILDMQAYFLAEASHAYIPSAGAVVPVIRALAAAFQESGRPVILTRHLNAPGDAGAMAHWWRDTIREVDPLSRLIPEIAELSPTVIRKTQYDAFHGTKLDSLLNALGVKQLTVTGVMTHLCCETTARSAFVRGYSVFFPVDATATYTEDHHRATVLNLSHGFAVPSSAQDLIARVRGTFNG